MKVMRTITKHTTQEGFLFWEMDLGMFSLFAFTLEELLMEEQSNYLLN